VPDEHPSPLESFALAVYGRDGVPAACLALQDGLGVDVNVVLFAAFVGAVRGEVLTESDVAAAGARVGGWHRDVVVALRTVRRRLKGYPAPASGVTATAELRSKLQGLEIDAELIELRELNELAVERSRSSAAGGPADRAAAAMVAVTGHVDHDLRDAVERIAAGAAELAR
jgi:uncharacterized protein (TIGR02444 family)